MRKALPCDYLGFAFGVDQRDHRNLGVVEVFDVVAR
jgi:hypothetical protein